MANIVEVSNYSKGDLVQANCWPKGSFGASKLLLSSLQLNESGCSGLINILFDAFANTNVTRN
jgi:hypothetical protein